MDRITHHPPARTDVPTVDVLILNSRGAANPWFVQALSSARDQEYEGCGVLVVDNNDHALSIGAGWNLGVQHSTADYVLFLGDDDYISFDMAGFLVRLAEKLRKRPELAALAMVTTGMTLVNPDNRVVAEVVNYGTTTGLVYMQQHHTGMWRRDWLLANPCNETLHKHVDSDMVTRLQQAEREYARRMSWASSYHYGYYYRQHIGKVSGEKLAYRKRQ